jgi:hypothetical protein
MQTYTQAQITGTDKTTLISYDTDEMTQFDTSETYTVNCSGCGMTALRTRFKWVPVDFRADDTRYLCIEEAPVTKWTCASCGPIVRRAR